MLLNGMILIFFEFTSHVIINRIISPFSNIFSILLDIHLRMTEGYQSHNGPYNIDPIKSVKKTREILWYFQFPTEGTYELCIQYTHKYKLHEYFL